MKYLLFIFLALWVIGAELTIASLNKELSIVRDIQTKNYEASTATFTTATTSHRIPGL